MTAGTVATKIDDDLVGENKAGQVDDIVGISHKLFSDSERVFLGLDGLDWTLRIEWKS